MIEGWIKMLLKNVTNYIEQLLADGQLSKEDNELALFTEEKTYAERHRLLSEEQMEKIIERNPKTRFQDSYIELCDKESDAFISEETAAFLEKPILYFKNHLEEFMYMESSWFDMIGADAVSFEADSVFGTYDVMLGLKLPKKAEKAIKSFLADNLNKENGTFDLMFNSNDGLWDLNFSLNGLNDYSEDWTINEAYSAAYRFLFHLVESVETHSNGMQ